MTNGNGNIPTSLIPANTTLLQPGSQYFRLGDALAALQIGPAVSAQINALQAEVTAQQAQITTLQGQVSTLQTQVQNLILFQNSFNWVQAEVSTGLVYLDSRTIYTRAFVIIGARLTAAAVRLQSGQLFPTKTEAIFTANVGPLA